MTLSTSRRVIGGIGLVAVVTAGVATLRPPLVPKTPPVQALIQTASNFGPRIVGLSVAVVTGILLMTLLLVSRPTKATDQTFQQLRDTPPETISETDVDLAGAAFEAAAETGRSDVGNQLRETAVTEVAFDIGETAARNAVATGVWTDNRPAALFVGDEVDPTLFERLRTWLDPESEHRRRLLATIAAIEARAEEDQR